MINNYELEFKLEFGETSANGTADFDEFHVLENADALVNLYGTLEIIGQIADPTDPVSSTPLNGGTEIATEAGTGSVADAIYQKEGYVDPFEHGIGLMDETADNVDVAKSASEDAKDGADDVDKALQDLSKKISEGNYKDAWILATDAAAGAALAEQAALAAEALNAEAQAAVVAVNQLRIDNPENTDFIKMALITEMEAEETAAFAAEARSYADALKADAATVATIWDDFLTNGPTADPEGFVEYLADIGSILNDNAKGSRDDAQSAGDEAVKKAQETSDKIDEGKIDEAIQKADEAIAFAGEAEDAAQIAEAAAADAVAAAMEANSMADADEDLEDEMEDELEELVDDAMEAEAYALDARTAADNAAAAAANAAALIAALP